MPEEGPTCDEELIVEVENLVQIGVPPLPAVMAQQVPEDVVEEWMESTQDIHVELRNRIKVAEARCESVLIGRVRDAAKTNWNAAAWLAERRFPDRYVRRSVNNTDGEDDGEIKAPDPFADLDADAKVVSIRKNK